uniref:Protein FAM50 homolog n=1 Tax=Mesocestoides corti TaxID=53468 RepID=A0A5K3FN06_MESCO
MQLLKQREKERQEIEFQKKKLEAELRVGRSSYIGRNESAPASRNHSKRKRVGAGQICKVKKRGRTARETRHCPQDEDEAVLTDEESQSTLQCTEKSNNQSEKNANSEGAAKTTEQFCQEAIEAGVEDFRKKRRRLGKNPDVDTSFLPDIDRDEEEKQLREELRREWHAKQAAIKEEEINITYSYWDGSGHRRQVKMKKGHSIHLFLHRCLDQLRKDFSELRAASADQMMYIKEDLIIPHHYTFYDFIVSKARGKSGPLFTFDVYDDVRLRMDASKEKEESHAGKVCLRSWYERHKHIFPASRWEPYDPAKNWDQYTISDKMSVKITIK